MKKASVIAAVIIIAAVFAVSLAGCGPIKRGTYYYEKAPGSLSSKDWIEIKGSTAELNFKMGTLEYSGKWDIVENDDGIKFVEKDGSGTFKAEVSGDTVEIFIGMGRTKFKRQ